VIERYSTIFSVASVKDLQGLYNFGNTSIKKMERPKASFIEEVQEDPLRKVLKQKDTWISYPLLSLSMLSS
jgi:hypothetical protein